VFAAAAHAPAVAGTQPGGQEQPEVTVSQVRAGDRCGRAVDVRVADVDQPAPGRADDADLHRRAVPQTVGGEFLEGEQQPLQIVESDPRRRGRA